MFTDTDKWAEIRRLVFVEGVSKRSVCRKFGIHWDAVNKILGHGEISRAIEVSAHRVSASARAKIEAAGGKVTVIESKS